ncbi:hypothetical protein [Streptomyces syringium]|uniref:hypothetical protein n=1 Tax=Streptomyces syringium TaxID=76729 RepID=UPI003452123E
MTGRTGDRPVVLFAGHRFDICPDVTFRSYQSDHVQAFVPHTAPAPPCGHLTQIRVRHSQDLFRRRMARLADAPSLPVVPFRGEPYRFSRIGDVSWWRPQPGSHLPQDHLYAMDGIGWLHVLIHPGTHRGERYLMRIIRESVLRCAETRGWAAFHAAATAVEGQGVLIAGPSGAGKTTVATALATHYGADLIASDRAVVTDQAAMVVGVPLSVRIGAGTLGALPPHHRLTRFRAPLGNSGHAHKASYTPRTFAHAFAARVRESAPLRVAVIPQLSDDAQDVTVSVLGPDAARAALTAACCTPDDEDWLHPWFADRTRPVHVIRDQAAQLVDDLVQRVPVVNVRAGVRSPHLLERLADTVTRRLT